MRGRFWPFSEDEAHGSVEEAREELLSEQDEADRADDRRQDFAPARRAE